MTVGGQTIFRNAAEVAACLAAPAPIVVVGIAESALYTSFDAVTDAIFLLLAYSIALGFTLTLGYPLYRLLVCFNVIRWWTSVLSGFAIGALVTILAGHSATTMSNEMLINSLAAAVSGLLFWSIQRRGMLS